MLDKQDIQQIGALLDEKLEEKLETQLDKRKLVSEESLKSILAENNKKLVTKDELKTILEENNEKLVDRIAVEVGNVIEQNVTPTLDSLDERVTRIDERLMRVEGQATGMDERLMRVETQMVTKSFLADQLGVLKEDTVGKVRKEDGKVNAVIHALEEQDVLNQSAIRKLRAIEVFPTSQSSN